MTVHIRGSPRRQVSRKGVPGAFRGAFGGRSARRKDRAHGAGQGATAAIWPGVEGGAYQPLSEAEIRMIDDVAMRILEEIGLRSATPEAIATVTAAGGS